MSQFDSGLDSFVTQLVTVICLTYHSTNDSIHKDIWLISERCTKPKDSVAFATESLVWYAVRELPSYQSPELFSSTVSDFLPAELEPLGFSSTGQLRVAS